MAGREEPTVGSYDGACLLLAAVVESAPELREEIRRRNKGRPASEAIAVVAELLCRIHHAARREEAKAAGKKVCSRCGRALDPEAFHKDKWRPDGRKSECIECRSAGKREERAGCGGRE